MSAQLDTLLALLDKVRRTGPDSYTACCPAHEDRHPSLVISEKDESIGLHCFTGCDNESILSAIGLTFSDLYPPRQHRRPANRLKGPATH